MSQETSNSQWLETYAIRYTVGTVVGAIIVYILCTKNDALRPMLLGLDIATIGNVHMLLLLAYGLCFCYIASGPILVLHTGRFYLKVYNKLSWFKKLLNLFLLFSIPILIIGLMFCYQGKNITSLGYIGFFLALIVLWGQYLATWYILKYKDALYTFYKELSLKRACESNKQIVDSYRRLKDHGNAFMILFCEFILGILLYIPSDINLVFVQTDIPNSNSLNFILLILWIVPSASIWLGSTYIEYAFLEDSK